MNVTKKKIALDKAMQKKLYKLGKSYGKHLTKIYGKKAAQDMAVKVARNILSMNRRSSQDGKITDWITVKGKHIPLEAGKTVKQSISNAFNRTKKWAGNKEKEGWGQYYFGNPSRAFRTATHMALGGYAGHQFAKNGGFQAIGKAGQNAWNAAKNYGGQALNYARNLPGQISSGATNMANNAIAAASNYSPNAARRLAQAIYKPGDLGKEMLEGAKGYGNQAIEGAKSLGNSAMNYGNQAWNAASKYGENALNAAKNYGSNAINAASNYGTQARNAFGSFKNGLAMANGQPILRGATTNQYFDMGRKFGETTNKIGSNISSAANSALQYGGQHAANFGNYISSLVGKASPKAAELFAKYPKTTGLTAAAAITAALGAGGYGLYKMFSGKKGKKRR